MYKVIGTRKARTFRVLWMLEELGMPYEHDPCMPRSPQALAASPTGKIPVMMVEDVAIAESTAILTYLADAHGGLTYPAGSVDRARQDAVTFNLLAELDAVLWAAAQHKFVLPEDKRVPEVKHTLRWSYERAIGHVSDTFVEPFIMGDTMTVPDILLIHCMRWAEMVGFAEPSETLSAYQDRMQERDAFKRTVELP